MARRGYANVLKVVNRWGHVVKFGSKKTGQVQALRGGSTIQSLLNSAAIVRAGALGFTLSGALFATPAWADCTPAAANGVTSGGGSSVFMLCL